MRSRNPVIAAVALAACGSPAPPVAAPAAPVIDAAAPRELVIGHFTSMTGSSAAFGISTDQGVRLAVDEQNAAGGIDGAQLRLVTLDDAGRTSEAGAVVQRLIEEEHAQAILGEVASSLSLAGGEVALAAGVPMIAPGANNPRVTEQGELIFQISLLDDAQGYAAARFAADMWFEPDAVVLLDESSAYAVSLGDAFARHLAAMGGQIVREQRYSGGAADPAAVAAALAGVDADVIYLPAYYPDAVAIIRAARDAGNATPFLGADGWGSPELAALGADALAGCFYTDQFSIHAPEAARFVEAYRARYGAPPDVLAALGYDAASVLFDAMARAPSHAGAELAAAIAATNGFHGVTGTLSFGADRLPDKPVLVLGFDQGVELVWARVDPPAR